jgi:hypothetical protein
MAQEIMSTIVNDDEFTIWENPTKHIVKFRLWIDAAAHKFTKEQWANGTRPRKYKDVEIPPGGSVRLEKTYDQAVQFTDKNGVIQSGLAPQLKKRGREPAPMHPSLDPATARRKELQEKVTAAAETAAIVQNMMQQRPQVVVGEDEELAELQAEIAKIDQSAPKGPKGK